MEEKYRKYKQFDWKNSEKWQQYYCNIVPVPPMARLEKIKRKWFRTNIDKEFDVDFDPDRANVAGQNANAN